MQNLTPSEIDALNKALGTPPHHTDSHSLSRAHFSQLHDSPSSSSLNKEIQDVAVQVDVILGRTKKTFKELLKLHEGSILTLDSLAGEPVELLANNKPIAKGEVIVADGNYAIRITEIL